MHGDVLASEDFSPQDSRAADADDFTYGYRERVQPVGSNTSQIFE